LQSEPDPVIAPAPRVLELVDPYEDDGPPMPQRTWVRMLLVLIGIGWLAVFVIAIRLDPYRDGRIWQEQTHTQLGLPPCQFKTITGVPCPSCGMTSSFALLMHGDVVESLKANFAGTLLACVGLAFVPWSVLSMVRGRWLGTRDAEGLLLRVVIVFVVVMMGRWLALMAWRWYGG
jgi:Protein of unknown function (DUF2752)